MENQNISNAKEHPFYTYFPFVQYYCPKVFNTLHIGNNLEDSTVQTPQTPEVVGTNPIPRL